ncbi:uncharacterized protein LOC129942154 isoform X4 [Eupeodes corollae]|uniref:uncharacterized protein LOC129942154 isoform X4 n=1 Tax=Eupeodes corollae TaxID=290404 RepID=UPI00248FF0B3|nr:uncharacterized protein LOC129942154 isoform X4 [Eupeodes corollae]
MLNEVRNIIELIELVKVRHAIYDFQADERNNRGNVDNLWNEVAIEMGATPSECKRKWASLRNALSRDLRNEKEASLNQSRKKKWYLADHLEFLRYHLKKRYRIPKGDLQADESMEADNENYFDLSTQDVFNEYLTPEESNNLEHKSAFTSIHSSTIVDESKARQSTQSSSPFCVPVLSSPSPSAFSAKSANEVRIYYKNQQSSNASLSSHEIKNKNEIQQQQRAAKSTPPKSFPHEIQHHQINQSSSCGKRIIEDESTLLDERNMTFFRSIIPDMLRLSDRKQRLYKQNVIMKLNRFLDEQGA